MHIHTKKILTGLVFLLLALPFVSCDDDDSNGGLPVIHRVRTTDPELKDSAFVQAKPGQMLLIEGENLGNVRKIYINDQDVGFNLNYMTSQTIIITIPNELKLTGANPELPKEIRVENKYGSTSYMFHVLSPEQEITRLVIEYPVETGDYIFIVGNNFYEIEKIVMEGENGTNVVIDPYAVSLEFNIIAFRLPEGVEPRGEVAVYCAEGEYPCPSAAVVLPPAKASISREMPII